MNQKMEYLRNGVRYCLLLILLVLAFATGAHAAQDDTITPIMMHRPMDVWT